MTLKKTFESQPEGVCCKNMKVTLNDGSIELIELMGGCPGWSRAVTNLLKNKSPEEVVDALKGITCGKRTTSCPDQLAKLLEETNEQ